MALRDIITKEDPILRRTSREVTDFGRRTQSLVEDLIETLIDAQGLGLAAPQVGVLRRAVIVYDGESYTELINPVITESSGEVELAEGCLSCPGEMGYVKRPQRVTVRAKNRFGKDFELTVEDMTARALCHELDHLDGVLYFDKATHMLDEREQDELFEKHEDDDKTDSKQTENQQ